MHNLIGAIELISDFNLKNERFFSFYLYHILMKEWRVYIFPILIGAEIYFCSSTDKLLNRNQRSKTHNLISGS